MAELIFPLVALGVLFALAINRAPLSIWALAVGLLTLAAQMGLQHFTLHWPAFPLWAIFGWLVAPSVVLRLRTPLRP